MNRILLLLLVVACVLISIALFLAPPADHQWPDVNLEKLGAFNKPFKSVEYLRAAIGLQKMGRRAACDVLMKHAKKKDPHLSCMQGAEVEVLCRMLFTHKRN